MQKNVALYQFRNGIPLTTAAVANFTRGELATALRKVWFLDELLACVIFSVGFGFWFLMQMNCSVMLEYCYWWSDNPQPRQSFG